MQLGLPADIHLAVSGLLGIFLDVRRDRYHAISLTPLAADMLNGKCEADDSEPSLHRLVQEGLLAPLAPGVRRCTTSAIEVPCASVLETGDPRTALSPRIAAQVGCALAWARFDLRVYRLDQTLERVRLRKSHAAGAPGIDADILARRARLFADHRALLPSRRVCLRDSLALLVFLGDAARGVELVFGVQARPFYAHCWIQTGTMILNDSSYFPATLLPILRI